MPKKAAKPKARTKTTAEKAEGQGGPLATTTELVRITGYDRERIRQLKLQGLIAPLANGKWLALETLSILFKRLRDTAGEAGKESRLKKQDFEAKAAELDFIQAAGELCNIADAEQFWSDGRIAIRQIIERSETLSPQQKNQLLGEISELKIEPPPVTKK